MPFAALQMLDFPIAKDLQQVFEAEWQALSRISGLRWMSDFLACLTSQNSADMDGMWMAFVE